MAMAPAEELAVPAAANRAADVWEGGGSAVTGVVWLIPEDLNQTQITEDVESQEVCRSNK